MTQSSVSFRHITWWRSYWTLSRMTMVPDHFWWNGKATGEETNKQPDLSLCFIRALPGLWIFQLLLAAGWVAGRGWAFESVLQQTFRLVQHLIQQWSLKVTFVHFKRIFFNLPSNFGRMPANGSQKALILARCWGGCPLLDSSSWLHATFFAMDFWFFA